jgi:hypothetical protein
LCTAGYGLAHGNWTYFLGAMNLFTINTIFIALATFIVLKVLRFPMLKYANSAKRRRTARFALLVAIVVMIYPTITFLRVLKMSGFENDYNNFISNEIKLNKELWFQNGTLNTSEKKITLYFNGEISDATESDLKNEIKSYQKISEFELEIFGNKNRSFDKISDAYDRAIKDLDEKDHVISSLRTEVDELREELRLINGENNTVSFTNLSRDAKVRFGDLQYFSYAKMLESKDFINTDTLDVATVKWSESLSDSLVTIKEKQLGDWLKQELKTKNVIIKRN